MGLLDDMKERARCEHTVRLSVLTNSVDKRAIKCVTNIIDEALYWTERGLNDGLVSDPVRASLHDFSIALDELIKEHFGRFIE